MVSCTCNCVTHFHFTGVIGFVILFNMKWSTDCLNYFLVFSCSFLFSVHDHFKKYDFTFQSRKQLHDHKCPSAKSLSLLESILQHHHLHPSFHNFSPSSFISRLLSFSSCSISKSKIK